LQQEFLVETALPPFSVALDPVAGCLQPVLPAPTFGRPEITARIAAVANEFQELRIRDRRAGNAKGIELDPMSPLFVVEMKSGVSRRTDQKLFAGQLDVSVQSALPCVVSLQRVRIAERLSRIVERLRVHVLMEERQLHEIQKPLVVRLPFEPRQHALQNTLLKFEGSRKVRKRQGPARVMRDFCGI